MSRNCQKTCKKCPPKTFSKLNEFLFSTFSVDKDFVNISIQSNNDCPFLFSVRATELESHDQVDSYDDSFLYTDGKQVQIEADKYSYKLSTKCNMYVSLENRTL